ncbi:TOBE domain-containing protein [Desulfovibrio sp. OttesenSCG-928-A18]|nr:TOBE domain-containing protein [Desulfovibrio sp. OttesenSCG-928-A18]
MQSLHCLINNADKNELQLILASVEKKLAEKGVITPVRNNTGALSLVPDGTKHLSAEELGLAALSFADWCQDAKNPIQRRSRSRLWLAFVLMRYGAMRLGEVLALNDCTDFDRERCLVLVRGANARAVLLPKQIMRQIGELLDSPMFAGIRGEALNLDPGYLRRKFYERARACGLAGGLFNPRIIRHSRAIELLRGGVPLQVVQSYLGQQNPGMTANYLEFSGETAQRIMQRYIVRESKMKTSARNSFTGQVTCIRRDGLLVEVELITMAGLRVVAVITEESLVNLRLEKGSPVTAIVKAPWVLLAEPGSGADSYTRNRFAGKISEVKESDIACEVNVVLEEGTIVCALITKESSRTLALKADMDIQVLFKAFSVILNVE